MRFLLLAVLLTPLFASDSDDQLVRDLLRELIEINTTHSIGSTGKAAEAMAARLRAAGFAPADVQVLGPRPERANLVARLHGTGARRPLLLISHLDVVEAKREDWTTDPFQFVEKDGYFYGRGTMDVKCGDAILVANLIRWKRENYKPDRDLIVALTANEEGDDVEENGIHWLLKNHRDLIDAEFCINPDGGNLETKKGKMLLNELQYGEKGFLSFTLEVKNKGGHSSLPEKENAIYRLSKGLVRLSDFDFPVVLDAGTRASFEAVATREGSDVAQAINRMLSTNPPDAAAVALLSKSAGWNAVLRTTCVATMLQAGHAENALPQSAKATINCRILPSETPAEVESTIRRVLHDAQIRITPMENIDLVQSPASDLRRDVVEAAKAVTSAMWPGVPVVPIVSVGGTDGTHLRRAGIPTYGISGIADDFDDIRAHGQDERIAATALYEGREFLFRLTTRLSTGN
ncbi:MAG TPA: M20/M25/M40 family metallo-hydrolase [Bryobacteraceae bacterium]|nr:M20/M25/M40 family metallo-hydrolase [Bryobacteraceae bacterium]